MSCALAQSVCSLFSALVKFSCIGIYVLSMGALVSSHTVRTEKVEDETASVKYIEGRRLVLVFLRGAVLKNSSGVS